MDRIGELVRELAAEYGPSGGEEQIRELLSKKMESLVDNISVDRFGNLVAEKDGSAPHIIIFAHMDEIGLMVKSIEENGAIRFVTIGGVEPEALLSQQVHICGKKGIVHGVITAKELHQGESFDTYPASSDMYIDVGLNTMKKVVAAGIDIGCYVIPRRAFAKLGQENIISGKAMDNRVGCAAAILVAERMRKKKRKVTYVFTVEEEMGLYGAKTSLYNLEVDLGIIIDATLAKDHKDKHVAMGAGPVLTYKDEEFIINRQLVEKVEHLLKEKRIRFQREVSDIGTTDAKAVSLSKGGVQTLLVSIPVRNIHSTISIADTNDIKETVALLEAVLTNPPVQSAKKAPGKRTKKARKK